MTTNSLILNELEQREKFKHSVMELVLSRCSTGKGFVRRNLLNALVYSDLGLQGQPGKFFAIFMNKLMAESGFRTSYSRGKKVYYGLTLKENGCQDQKESLKASPENQESAS